jgi:hypothetical protein
MDDRATRLGLAVVTRDLKNIDITCPNRRRHVASFTSSGLQRLEQLARRGAGGVACAARPRPRGQNVGYWEATAQRPRGSSPGAPAWSRSHPSSPTVRASDREISAQVRPLALSRAPRGWARSAPAVRSTRGAVYHAGTPPTKDDSHRTSAASSSKISQRSPIDRAMQHRGLFLSNAAGMSG